MHNLLRLSRCKSLSMETLVKARCHCGKKTTDKLALKSGPSRRWIDWRIALPVPLGTLRAPWEVLTSPSP